MIPDRDLALAAAVLADALRRSGAAEDEDEATSVVGDQALEHEDAEEPADEAPTTNGGSPHPTAPPGSLEIGSTTALRIRRAIDSVGADRAPADPKDVAGGPDDDQPKLVDHVLAFSPPSVPSADDRPRRERTRSDYTAGTGRGRAGGGFSEVDKDIEAEAIEIAMRYSASFGAVAVRDVQSQNLGWDLEFVMKDGQIIPVEVKGSRGDTAFMITRNERRAASSPEYLLLWVINLRKPAHALIRRFTGLGSGLTDDHLSPLSWIVDRWPSLTYDEVRVQTLDDDST